VLKDDQKNKILTGSFLEASCREADVLSRGEMFEEAEKSVTRSINELKERLVSTLAFFLNKNLGT
jgi:hypothetical protein